MSMWGLQCTCSHEFVPIDINMKAKATRHSGGSTFILMCGATLPIAEELKMADLEQ